MRRQVSSIVTYHSLVSHAHPMANMQRSSQNFPLLSLLVIALSHSHTTSESITSTLINNQPHGSIVLFAGEAIPSGWLLCDEQAVSRVTYFPLFKVISTLYGDGDHIRTFNMPDFRGRFPLDLDQSNGQRPGMLQGGITHVTLTQAELPAHVHASGSLQERSVKDNAHLNDDLGHDHGGRTGSAVFGQGGNGRQKNGHGADFNSHSHTIQRDTTYIIIEPASAHDHPVNGETSSIGIGAALSVMNPYQAVYYITYSGPDFTSTIGCVERSSSLPGLIRYTSDDILLSFTLINYIER